MCIITRCHTTSFIQVLKKEFLRRKTTEILDLLSTVRLCQTKYHKSAQQILQKMFFKKTHGSLEMSLHHLFGRFTFSISAHFQ